MTDKGLRHSINEDCIFFNKKVTQSEFFLKKGIILGDRLIAAIFDGVGGAKFGDLASKTAASILKKIDCSCINDRLSVINLVQTLNNSILTEQNKINTFDMYSTFVGIFINSDRVIFANVGDSKVYLYHNESLILKSVEDTYKNKLLKEGKIPKNEIEKLDTAHMITSYLGKIDFEKNKSHFFESKLVKDDRILLMSDGVSDLISEIELLDILRKQKKINNIIKEIRKIVISRGAHDNFSIIIVEV